MVATVAILGRPNVGKSTLFNRLAGKRLAIVEPEPGVTRDWKEGEASLAGVRFRLLDTPGLEDARPGTIEAAMRVQAERALALADVALLLFDAREGVTPLDSHFGQWLRTTGKNVILVANKCEARVATAGAMEGFALGLGDPVLISAEHGEGMADLYEALAPYIETEDAVAPPPADWPEDEGEEEGPRGPLRLAVVGRPNVGKSTLVNRLVGEERVLTGPQPGITRDAVPVDWIWRGHPVRLVDTAGLRRRAQVVERIERMSVEATARAIRLAEVVVLVLDATVMLERQDLAIARNVVEEGRAIVIAANKWDLVDDPRAALAALNDRIERSLPQIKGIRTVTLSAMTGENTDRLMQAVFDAYEVMEPARADRRAQPLARRPGAGASAAGGQGTPAAVALHDPDQGAAADLRAVRKPTGRAAGELRALPGERPACGFQAGRRADPHRAARRQESLRAGRGLSVPGIARFRRVAGADHVAVERA